MPKGREMLVEGTIKEMLERHKEEIKYLQDTCNHLDISDWMPYMWAPGHFSHNVKVCNICGKIMEEDKI